MTHWKQILTLLILTSVLTELLSGNIPPSNFFVFPTLIILMTIGYGFPVLVLREVMIRMNLGLIGLFVLGIIYGFYNEALIAKTIFSPFPVVDPFATYGLFGNIRVPWMLLITSWHAFYAVIFPIMFVSYLFPEQAKESWFSKKMTMILGGLCIIIGSFIFFNANVTNPKEIVGNYLFIFVTWILLWIAVKKCPKIPLAVSQDESLLSGWKIFGIGFVLNLLLVAVLFFFGGAKVPVLLYIIYFFGWMVVLIRKARKVPLVSFRKMTLIGLGATTSSALIGIPVNFASGRVDQVIASILFVTIFSVVALKIRKIKAIV